MNNSSSSALRALQVRLGGLRRRLGLVTEAEARLAYLEQAQNVVDLEMRMRELDRRPAEMPLHLSGSLRL
jgi:hypothetical protein